MRSPLASIGVEVIQDANFNFVIDPDETLATSGGAQTFNGPIKLGASLPAGGTYYVHVLTNGIDSKYGMFTTYIEDASLARVMISMSKEVIVVTDSSKFQKRSFSIVAPINTIDILVTDANIPKDESRNLSTAGVSVIIA